MSAPPESTRSSSREGGERIPPHPPLTRWYGNADDRQHRRWVVDIFDRTARHYNTIEKIFGNGGLWYRRFSLKRAGLQPGMRVLDVAIGTAAVSRGAVQIVGPTGLVIGCDPSAGMIREARRNFSGPISRGVAEALPFRDDQFDFVTMGIALRHVPDLVAAFREYHRVLKPGGRVWILEGHVPKSQLGQRLTRWFWAKVVPGATQAFTRDDQAKLLMDFYWDTVEQCVPPERILEAMHKAGFEDARFKVVVSGAFCEYHGRKAPAGG
jgi:demethylmenaquinone methyltransferase/2-methoxy-6-polyprenyl-1,4-benzoquinol methylase